MLYFISLTPKIPPFWQQPVYFLHLRVCLYFVCLLILFPIIYALLCSLKHCLQEPRYGNKPKAHQEMSGIKKLWYIDIMEYYLAINRMKSHHL